MHRSCGQCCNNVMLCLQPWVASFSNISQHIDIFAHCGLPPFSGRCIRSSGTIDTKVSHLNVWLYLICSSTSRQLLWSDPKSCLRCCYWYIHGPINEGINQIACEQLTWLVSQLRWLRKCGGTAQDLQMEMNLAGNELVKETCRPNMQGQGEVVRGKSES